MTDEPFKAAGMSAAERDVRRLVADLDGYDDDWQATVVIGNLRALIYDIEMWREISSSGPGAWGFDTLVFAAKRILDMVYPEDIFTGASLPTGWDVGPNSGVAFVIKMRELIKEVERGNPAREHQPPLVYDMYADDGRKITAEKAAREAADTPRLGDSDADIEIIGRIIAEHIDVSEGTLIAADGAVSIIGIHDAARAIIELIRQNRGAP